MPAAPTDEQIRDAASIFEAMGWTFIDCHHPIVNRRVGQIRAPRTSREESSANKDDQLEKLPSLPFAFYLDLTKAGITDTSLAKLAGLKNLVMLNLDYNHGVTDTGLKELAGLPNLCALSLACVPLTDAGLKDLAPLTSLLWLALPLTNITDDGLDQLTSLTNMQHLDLSGCHVTSSGVDKLRKALPRCEIDAPVRNGSDGP